MLGILRLILDAIVLMARLLRPDGKSLLVAEHLLVRQQLLLMRRKSFRAPRLTFVDRLIFAVTSLFIGSSRLPKLSIVVAHSTLLRLHKALVERKYSKLFSNKNRKPGPKGPTAELIKLIIEIKQKNPRYGYPKIALLVSQVTGKDISEQTVRRILQKYYLTPIGGGGPSWLSLIGNAKDTLWSLDMFCCESISIQTHWVILVMDQFTRRIIGVAVHLGPLNGPDICRMFLQIRLSKGSPKYLSSDHDPLFNYFQWQANLRILEIDEIKSVSEIPWPHPFIERLIGTLRREYLDHQLFWNERDLQRKLDSYIEYYNAARVHYSLKGQSPKGKAGNGGIKQIDLSNYQWQPFCNGKFSIPIPA